MIRFSPLMLLALAACDAPLEQVYPRRTMVVEHQAVTYRLRAQYDPVQFAWFASVWSPGLDLTEGGPRHRGLDRGR